MSAKTTEEFREEIRNLVGDEYLVTSEYIPSDRGKVEFYHTKCKKYFSCRAIDFTYGGQRCKCRFMEKTIENISKLIPDFDILNLEYNSKIKLCCKKCGKIISRDYKSFRSRINQSNFTFQCPDCKPANPRILDINEVKRRLFERYNGTIEIIDSTYISVSQKAEFVHSVCGQKFKSIVQQVMTKTSCPYCYGTPKKTQEQFEKEFYDTHDKSEYKVLGAYNGGKTKLRFKHLVCGNVLHINPQNAYKGVGCIYCLGNNPKGASQFQEDLNDFFGNGIYKVIGNYINNKTPIEILHTKCNNIISVRPNSILKANYTCPKCEKRFSSEMLISKILSENNISFRPQKVFKDLRSNFNGHLFFDFYLIDRNIVIEYDGEFHYQPIMGENSLIIQQTNDHTKDQYCKDHKIPILRIPYWNKDRLEEIITGLIINLDKGLTYNQYTELFIQLNE